MMTAYTAIRVTVGIDVEIVAVYPNGTLIVTCIAELVVIAADCPCLPGVSPATVYVREGDALVEGTFRAELVDGVLSVEVTHNRFAGVITVAAADYRRVTS